MKQLDLIEPNLPVGFRYFQEFITREEEDEILANLEFLNWRKIKMFGVESKRETVHFGMDYNYESRSISPTNAPPTFLIPLINKVARKFELHPDELEEILISHYPPGAGIGWHKDAPMFETVIGVSLKNDCLMKLRLRHGNIKEDFEVTLEPRSLYIISGIARWEWQHHIKPVIMDRYSITFRTLRNSPNLAS